ncbi:MAG: hypothetical protein LBV29_03060 [Azoarcus sp.]|jgi:hypothetical protein|nr:hypothetical protein [Azoarcus sp.]
MLTNEQIQEIWRVETEAYAMSYLDFARAVERAARQEAKEEAALKFAQSVKWVTKELVGDEFYAA